MIKNLSQISIKSDSPILQALKRMDEIRRKLLIVFENDKYTGLLSIGDIQRAIINNTDLGLPIKSIMRNDIILARRGDSIENIKVLMLKIRSEFMPVVNEEGHLVDIYFWEDFFGDKKPEPSLFFDLPVAIMAGGFGSRLRPLTNIIPKPLIPIREKTMLEEIFDHFAQYGCKRFYISVNYKADLIKYYIQKKELGFQITYLEESKPLGTAGGLSLLKGKIDQTLFVTNCDILIDQDYSEILKYHYENKNEVTVVAALKHLAIPYGIIETGENGNLMILKEKPEITLKINSGMYIMEPSLINEIPDDNLLHITDFIGNLQSQGRRIGVFPVRQSSWLDVGDWKDYLEVLGQYRRNI